MNEQNNFAGSDRHGESLPIQQKSSLRRRFITDTTLTAIGTTLEGASIVYANNPRFPGNTIINTAAELVSVLPQDDARAVVEGTIMGVGIAISLNSLTNIRSYRGEILIRALSYKADFSSEGLIISTHKTYPESRSVRQYGFPKDIRVGRVDFIPNGHFSKDPAKTTQNLFTAITQLQEYFNGLDAGKYPKPQYLYGTTNKYMTKLAKRLGAVEVDQLPKSRIHEERYRIVGETDIIRTNLESLISQKNSKGQTLVEVLKNRLTTE